MGTALLAESLMASMSLGLGCGTGCGSGISALLYGYIACHAGSVKQSSLDFLRFFFGKAVAVIALCITASIIGNRFLENSGTLFGVNMHVIADLFMIGMGLFLIYKWVQERKGCSSCKSCKGGGHHTAEDSKGGWSLLSMGLIYGISPCAPLIIVTGYSAILPVYYSALLGLAFAAASTVSPTLVFIVLSGVLGRKMRQEMPSALVWFRLGCYVLLIVLFTASLCKEVF